MASETIWTARDTTGRLLGVGAHTAEGAEADALNTGENLDNMDITFTREALATPTPSTETTRDTLAAVRLAAGSWTPSAKLMGNVSAERLLTLCDDYATLRERLAASEREADSYFDDWKQAVRLLDEARAEADAMRAVVEAAKEVCHWNEQTGRALARDMSDAIQESGRMFTEAFNALVCAVRALDAGVAK